MAGEISGVGGRKQITVDLDWELQDCLLSMKKWGQGLFKASLFTQQLVGHKTAMNQEHCLEQRLAILGLVGPDCNEGPLRDTAWCFSTVHWPLHWYAAPTSFSYSLHRFVGLEQVEEHCCELILNEPIGQV